MAGALRISCHLVTGCLKTLEHDKKCTGSADFPSKLCKHCCVENVAVTECAVTNLISEEIYCISCS